MLEAIRGRQPQLARENMAVLLSSTGEFLEHELGGRVQNRVGEGRTAAG
ncbi:MAG TPA: hypothetical protein VN664_15465 [Burkholderiales bacterium]|nr:hypothetical protein [Burkholderiales bacterium]